MGAAQRSDVRCQLFGRMRSPAREERLLLADDRTWVEAELKDVDDQALMRGLVTAFPIVRPGLLLSYCGRRPAPATKRLTGIPLPLSRLRPCAMMSKHLRRLGCVRLSGDGPHKADQFTGDRGANHGRSLASRRQLPITSCQTALRLPGNLAHLRRRLLKPIQLCLTNPRRMTLGPCALDQHMADPAVAGLGDTAAPDRLAGRALARDETEITHELARALETAHLADLGRKCHGDD